MKKLLSIIGIAAIVLSVMIPNSARAQAYSGVALGLPGINAGLNAVATGTNTLFNTNYTAIGSMPTIGAIKQRYIAVSETHFNLNASGTTNQYWFIPSVDGVNYNTNASDSITFSNVITGAAGAGGTKTSVFDTYGYGYYKLSQVVQTGTGVSTNSTFSYSIKIQSP